VIGPDRKGLKGSTCLKKKARKGDDKGLGKREKFSTVAQEKRPRDPGIQERRYLKLKKKNAIRTERIAQRSDTIQP